MTVYCKIRSFRENSKFWYHEIWIFKIDSYYVSFTDFESVSQIGANSTTITAEQKLKIREYVEEVVAKLLGGNLDTIAVNQLSKSENCKYNFFNEIIQFI